MATLLVEIITPESSLWSGEANAFVGRTSEGFFTVLAEHTPYIGDLVPGVVKIEANDGVHEFVQHGGYFQVFSNHETSETHVNVLVGTAEDVRAIDVTRAQAAKEAAQAALAAASREDENDVGVLALQDDLSRAELRLSVAVKA